MFEDLYDAISRLWSWSWPTAQGEVTDVGIERAGDGSDQEARLWVCYKFWVNEDGPYCGEDFWKPAFSIGALKRLRPGPRKLKNKQVPVRYRRDDPSVNRLDREAWRGL